MAGNKLMGVENRLSYSVVGLRTCDSFPEHCCVAQRSQESAESMQKERDGVGF